MDPYPVLDSSHKIVYKTEEGTYTNDIDPDGIRAVYDGQRAMDNVIFNLSGQRLSRLRKGINIVNGQKVLVK